MKKQQSPNFEFRRIQSEDSPVVAEVVSLVMEEFDAVGEGYSIMDKELEDMYEAYKGERCAYWVITLDDKIVGCGGIAPLEGADETYCELKKMYYLPIARGHGMGRKMVELCLRTAKRFGYKYCYLETLDRMATANLLYQRMGFVKLNKTVGNTGHTCNAFYQYTL